ncbi:MAG: NAD-dependent malic enzyme [Actinobacteria bacterium]|nr:NAD-dependent malic enzyme [Actinomycetota bacterium]
MEDPMTRRGHDILHDPLLNHGTAHTREERDRLGLRGLLPHQVIPQEVQEARVLENFHAAPTDLARYTILTNLQDRNESLFYRVVTDNIETMMPIIYTPTVGQACQEFSHLFRRSRGMYITIGDRGEVADLLANWPHDDVRVIVVTDGERILGLGDLGSNGMGIPIGKLSLYTACAGIDPATTLPVTIDVGTDNHDLFDDPFYVGMKQPRVRGEAYDALLDEFMEAVTARFPRALIQFEDFGNANAFRLLRRYRDRYCTFNDDIQGTAAVALAGVLSALRITGGNLAEQRFLFHGAGGAGLGIANLIVSALTEAGLTTADARARCWFVDSRGLVVASRTDLTENKLPFAHEAGHAPDLLGAVDEARPTFLIGVSGQHGAFTQDVVRRMAELNERPAIFALSNPTSKAECTAARAYEWTEGRAVFSSGSPFAPVEYQGRTLVPGQGNNAYMFPGVGLGVTAVESGRVTDEMFMVAARTLAGLVSEDHLASGSLYPPLRDIREISAAIAVAVAELAHSQGLARVPRPEDLAAQVRDRMWSPVY